MLLSKKNQATNYTLLLILCCLALYISCDAAITNVEAATMLRVANHRQESTSLSRELEQIKDSDAKNIQEWPDDDDDDDIDIIQSKNTIVDHAEDSVGNSNAENATSTFDNDETEKPTQLVSEEEDTEGDDEEIITNDQDIDINGELQNDNASNTEEIDTNNEVGNIENTTLVMGEENPTTEYHRSQSTIQNEAPADSTGDTRTFDQSENIDMNKGQVSEDINTENSNVVDGNEINDGGNNNMATVGENANNVDSVVAPMEQANPQQQVPLENAFVNYNEDDEEESFFTMIQSTLQVLFLAAFFSSGLVFRRRVMDRMNDHPSMNVSHAIQEEVVKGLTDLASWLSESRNESSRDIGGGGYSMSTVVEGGSSVGGSGSSRTETIPLATATDEEWGWDDEDVGGNLELSGVGGDNATEEDDLAMAIAMSLSEPANVDRSETVRPPADAVSKHSAPTMEFAVEKSTNQNNQLEQIAPPPPADTIEDLLGQMSSAGGPVISSFGQKTTKIEPKSKPKPIRNDADDIFESMGMGLSSFATKTGPSQQQTNIPSSTLLKAESIDEDDDNWDDDGDLDDLLLED